MRSILNFSNITLMVIGFSMGCGLTSSLIPGIDDNETPSNDAGSVVDAAPEAAIKDANSDVDVVLVNDAEPDAPETVIQDAGFDAPIRERTIPEAGDGDDSGDDSGMIDDASPVDGSDDSSVVMDAGTPVVDANIPVADAAPQCYTKCDNDCVSCKWVCTSTPNCTDGERQTCSLQCIHVQTNCHTVCDVHGCGGY